MRSASLPLWFWSTFYSCKLDCLIWFCCCLFFNASQPETVITRCPSSLTSYFDVLSETAERKSTKLGRKQDLNVLYQACVFRTDRKNKKDVSASDWLRNFRLLHWNRSTEFNEYWLEARSQCLLPILCFFFGANRKKQDGRPTSDWLRHFRLLLWHRCAS